jgi:hypothetical protein
MNHGGEGSLAVLEERDSHVSRDLKGSPRREVGRREGRRKRPEETQISEGTIGA